MKTRCVEIAPRVAITNFSCSRVLQTKIPFVSIATLAADTMKPHFCPVAYLWMRYVGLVLRVNRGIIASKRALLSKIPYVSNALCVKTVHTRSRIAATLKTLSALRVASVNRDNI